MLQSPMDIQTVTITVSDITRSTSFYADVLGFTAGDYYEPTRWQPFTCGDRLFGIRQMDGFQRSPSFDITNFEVNDVATLWGRVREQSVIVEELAPTPWGSYRFVIEDPDGYWLAFVQKKR